MKFKENLSDSVFFQILDSSNYYVFALNYDDNRIYYQNKLADQDFGIVKSRKFKDLFDISGDNSDLSRAINNPKTYFDYKTRPKTPLTGEFFDSQRSKYYQFNTYGIVAEGQIKLKIVILNDITLKREFEIESNNQKKLLDTIIDNSPVAIWFYSKDGTYPIINSFIKDSLIIGDEGWSIKNEEIHLALNSDKDILKSRDSVIQYEQATFKDGRVHQFKTIRKKIYNNNNEVIGVVGIGIDVTDVKAAQDRLKYLKTLYELISSFSSRLIHCKVSDIDYHVNDTLKQLGIFTNFDRIYLCHFDHENKIVKYDTEWVVEPNLNVNDDWVEFPFSRIERWFEKFNQNLFMLIQDTTQIPNYYKVEKKELESRNVKSMIAFPLFFNSKLFGYIAFDSVKEYRILDNDIIYLLKIATEIIAGTIARKDFEIRIIEAMNSAEEANRTKSEFLANMSHEIRTPMNAILGFSEILQESISSGVQRSYLNTIINSGRNLMRLINDILDLSKIESGRIDIIPEPVNLGRIYSEIEKIFEIKIKDKRLEYIIELDPRLDGYWLFDETRIRQILFNVVGNAIKFTDNGYIKIDSKLIENTETNKKDIEITIEDSGIGIPEEHQKRIFDSFYQVSSKSGKRYDGTGLGLAITMRLIKAMNGEIHLKSTPNIGTAFTIRFKDVMQAEVAKIVQQEIFPEISKEFSFKGARILVVDDIDNNRQMIKIFIESFDGIVLEADNGDDAIKLANFYRPSAIILDIRMPGMSGFEVLHHLRESEKTIDIPVIALTAVSSAFQEKHLYRNFNGVLTKPVRKEELINKLDDILNNKI